jgi:hypothetical protein
MGKKERERGKKEKKRGEKREREERIRRGALFEKLYKYGTGVITISLCITYSYQ